MAYVYSIPSDDYTVLIENDGSGNPIYIGYAVPGTASNSVGWKIKKIGYDGSGNPTSTKWANSSKAFSFIWDSRAGYTYA